MADSYLTLAMKRLAAGQAQTMSALGVNADAKHYYPYEQDIFPYWYNVLATMDEGDYADDYGMDIKSIVWEVNPILVVGHVSSGYKAERAENVYDYASAYLDYFIAHRDLTSAAYPTGLDYLVEDQVRISGSAGLVALQNTGTQQQQIGMRFTVSLPFIRQAY